VDISPVTCVTTPASSHQNRDADRDAEEPKNHHLSARKRETQQKN